MIEYSFVTGEENLSHLLKCVH